MTPETLVRAIESVLPAGQPVLDAWRTPDGMNSVTVGVTLPGGRYVAKWVPDADGDALLRGARAAAELADAGVRSGAPTRLVDGAWTAPLAGGEVALLREVTGTPLTGEQQDQPSWGAALGRVHRLTPRERVDMKSFLADLGLDGRAEYVASWIGKAVSTGVEGVVRIGGVAWVQLHSDPAPEAFLRDVAGDVGVIDWTGSRPGPALYDVASAVMYAGGMDRSSRFLAAYSEQSGFPVTSIQSHLTAFLRLRGAVQAVYFGDRITATGLTGAGPSDDDEKGLEDARHLLDALGV